MFSCPLPWSHLEATASMLPHWGGLSSHGWSCCCLGRNWACTWRISSWTHVPLGASRCRFLVLSSSCEKLHACQLTFFFQREPPLSSTPMCYRRASWLAAVSVLLVSWAGWCPIITDNVSILTLLALSRVKFYKWRGKSNLNQTPNYSYTTLRYIVDQSCCKTSIFPWIFFTVIEY